MAPMRQPDKPAYTKTSGPSFTPTYSRKSLVMKCPAELLILEGAYDFKAYWSEKLKLFALKYCNRRTQMLEIKE
ncbi:MAG: hypothetical protein ABIR84_11865 [Candidatus Nitrotoga sp.]